MDLSALPLDRQHSSGHKVQSDTFRPLKHDRQYSGSEARLFQVMGRSTDFGLLLFDGVGMTDRLLICRLHMGSSLSLSPT